MIPARKIINMSDKIPYQSSEAEKNKHYRYVRDKIEALLAAETDWVAAMATTVCELHHSFEYYHWTGFYRVVSPNLLKIGPYQGSHGCLEIPFTKGVCGAAARLNQVQLVDDVSQVEDHIACSTSTKSEIVVPICTQSGLVTAVIDVDSDFGAAFSKADQDNLEAIAALLSEKYFFESQPS